MFVCSHDFGCCLSSGGMYTCSSPTLVHLSALRCFRWPAMLSFSSSFITFIQSYFVCRFFFFVSPLTHLNFRCLFVCSVSHGAGGFVHALLSLSGSRQVHLSPCGLDSGSYCFVTTLLSNLAFFSLFALWWSLSLISRFLEAALYLFSIQRAQQRT